MDIQAGRGGFTLGDGCVVHQGRAINMNIKRARDVCGTFGFVLTAGGENGLTNVCSNLNNKFILDPPCCCSSAVFSSNCVLEAYDI